MRIEYLLDQIRFARAYSLNLLEATPVIDWFRIPTGGVSHVAWQAGHLAIAEYRLALERIRGTRPEDERLIAPELVKLFAYASVPQPDPGVYPSAKEIRVLLDRVHTETCRELAGLGDAELDQPPLKPHPLAKTKLESLRFCSHHEMIHAGQIGLLRRQLGHNPVR